LSRALQLRVGDLDTLLGHIDGLELAPPSGFRGLLGWRLARGAGAQLCLRVSIFRGTSVVRIRVLSVFSSFSTPHDLELGSQRIELLLRLAKLDLELPVVDALGLGHEESPLEQSELLQYLLIGSSEVIALDLDLAQLGRHLGQLRIGGGQLRIVGGQLDAWLSELDFERFDSRFAQGTIRHERAYNNSGLGHANRNVIFTSKSPESQCSSACLPRFGLATTSTPSSRASSLASSISTCVLSGSWGSGIRNTPWSSLL